ncbi:MAG: hypothetical protein U0903_11995 [Planctomycetales bacterium]
MMRRITRCGLCVLLAGLSLVVAAEPAKKEKPPKTPKVKIIYTFSNSGGGPLTIELEALGTQDEDTVYKKYVDHIPDGKTKHMSANVYDADGEDFLVTVLQGSNVKLNQRRFFWFHLRRIRTRVKSLEFL